MKMCARRLGRACLVGRQVNRLPPPGVFFALEKTMPDRSIDERFVFVGCRPVCGCMRSVCIAEPDDPIAARGMGDDVATMLEEGLEVKLMRNGEFKEAGGLSFECEHTKNLAE